MKLGEAPDKSSLDPIEMASRDEITALQTLRPAQIERSLGKAKRVIDRRLKA